ncbi:MAG: RagB/SusD family nutrient uptake outer membrane protein [Bacteroidales bacterium]|nr:RagB/SusD family nutrient uptake outer membrane protein [Bacteroidales bacterium]
MNILKTLSYLVLSGTILTGCSLELDPISDATELTEGTLEEEMAAVLKDKQAALDQRTNLYQLLRNRQEHWSLDMLLIAESHSDNAYAGTTGAEVVPYETNSIDASNSVLSRDWSRYLEDIAKSNVLINGLDALKDQGMVSEAEYNQMKAEGCIFRALVMFDMARLWGSFPVITDIAQTITSANVEEVYPVYFPPQKTTQECYAQIIEDLEFGEKYAPDFSASDRTLLTKTVAQAMLAKVYAEKPVQDYSKVIEYAQSVIQTPGLALEPDYTTLWGYNEETKDCIKRNTSEGILEIHYTAGNGNWATWMYGRQLDDYDNSFTWAKWITPSRDLIRDFENEGDTKRLNESVVYYECKWSNYYPSSHYAFMYKNRSSYQNVYKIRLADIILLEAEAHAYQGDAAKAAALVNTIRERVGLEPVDASGDMIKTVLHERRLELAFEGQRWFDLCRNNMVEEYLNAVYAKDEGRLKQYKAFDQNSYLLPVPQTALDENSNLVQNPGY